MEDGVLVGCQDVYSQNLRTDSKQHGHTCGDSAGTGAEAVMSKIGLWL
jgi:hypothetical protein